ncbi:hypothetical protein NUU61_005404 [Penicillium alfredii]|uniref:N-alpha-acetyltransferase 40 n=1 Tax=Penicillium alfredii TaxID=1506179 RepID=A0A9W9F9D2_9EURO|nr:uncharacterized protein NUU61_005404 [Penicillium alfredii]KAJ5096048.1 hypothetical protein NUU61_005404 [Penicillium alfredii]
MPPSTKEGRVIKPKTTQTGRRVQSHNKNLPLVERTNALLIHEFISHYVTPLVAAETQQLPADVTKDQTGPVAGQSKQDASPAAPLDVYSAASISNTDLEACLDLIELTSGEAYSASSMGWSRTKKRKEMKLPDMKYLIVREDPKTSNNDNNDNNDNSNINKNNKNEDRSHLPTEEGGEEQRDVPPDDLVPQPAPAPVLGFLSFMVTYEDSKEVVYCYEIHLSPTARGWGIGKMLMGRMEEIGRLVGLEKAMLTVFKSNESARRFYERVGYEIDEYSPRPRKLRNGTIKDVDYLILSKKLK